MRRLECHWHLLQSHRRSLCWIIFALRWPRDKCALYCRDPGKPGFDGDAPSVRRFAAFAVIVFILSMIPAPGLRQGVCAGRVPDETGKIYRSVSQRWHQRHRCPNRRRQVAGEVGPAGHHRESRRRRRQHRRCAGGAGGGRWLHPAGLVNAAARHQPEPLQAVALQSRKNSWRSRISDRCPIS